MKRTVLIMMALAALTLISGAAVASEAQGVAPYSSIRGTVYEDADGNGFCPEPDTIGDATVPDVAIVFTSGGATITLYTGDDGTYGLATAAAGDWQVTAIPDPSSWVVTSQNPLYVTVASPDELVRTGVNFCVQRWDGNVGSLAATNATAFPSQSTTGQGASESSTAGAALAPVSPSVISEALLTNPPAPQPAPNLEALVGVPVEPSEPTADWLNYLNQFREMGDLEPLTESTALSQGSQWHSRYMVVNDRPIAHSENWQNPLFSEAGHQAAKNGNIFATTQLEANYIWSMNFWVSGPFHLIPLLDPGLTEVGYGAYREDVGTFNMAAVLDVRTQLGETPEETQYPLLFPGDGAETWVVRHSLFEWPNPVVSCPGYARPTGAPIVVQLGDGDLTPDVSRHVVLVDGVEVTSCLFDETDYVNSDAYAQQTGRIIMDERDAVVIIPRNPLPVGSTITVELEANGETINWSFNTVSPP